MQSPVYKLSLIFCLVLSLQATAIQQTAPHHSKIRDYQELLNLDLITIKSNCTQIKHYYDRSIEAYDFIQSFTIEAVEETLQNIGKLRTLGNELQQQSIATFEQLALKDQLDEQRNKHKLDELQWRVNWSSTAQSSDVPLEEINEMKEEITQISSDKQQELDEIIQQKITEQDKLTEQIQLGESSYNKLNADKKDINVAINVLNDRLDNNSKELKETLEANSTRGDKLITLQLQQKFFENQKRIAISFGSIKQLAQLTIRTQDEITQLNNDIEDTNNKVIFLQESDAELKDSLTTKNAEMQQIELEMESVNTQLLQIRQQSQDVTNLIEMKKKEQSTLLSQLIQPQQFLQMSKQLKDSNTQLQHTQEKLSDCKLKIEILEKEQSLYSEKSTQLQQQTTELNSKLLTLPTASEKAKLQEEIELSNTQYQKAWNNYIKTKEELIKEKQLLVSLENYEESIGDDQLNEQEETIKKQQEREDEIEGQSYELDNALNRKKQEQREIIDGIDEQNYENDDDNDDDFIVIPSPKSPNQSEQQNTQQQELKSSIYHPQISQESQKQLENASENKQKQNLINEIKELMNNYEELIIVKEQHVKEKLVEIVVKEDIVNNKENEINQASEKIKQEVEKCKQENREIIIEAKQQRDNMREKIVEKDLKNQIDLLNSQIKEEFKKQGEIFKKKQIIENIEEKIINKQAKIDQKVEEIQKRIFKDMPTAKKFDKIKIDLSGMHASSTNKLNTPNAPITTISSSKSNGNKVSGSTIPLAYPLQNNNYIKKNEIIGPEQQKFKEQQLEQQEENINIKQQEKQKEIVQEQKQQINEQQKQIQSKENEIKIKEQKLEEKKKNIQQQINQLDQDIAHCKKIINQEEEDSQEYQMCQWQSSDYEQKRKQLEQMKVDYENQSQEFFNQKQQFYQQSSFLELNTENYQSNFNVLIQLQNRNKKCLAKSIRHNDGMVYLLESANKLSENLQTLFLQVQSDNGQQFNLIYQFFIDEVKNTLQEVLDQIDILYETAIIQRNLKQEQNKLLEQKKKLMKMRGVCLKAERILQK